MPSISCPSAPSLAIDWLRSQFDESGDLAYLERAIAYQHKAIALLSVDDPLRCIALDSLALSFTLRFKHHCDVEDIKRAVLYSTQAANTAPGYMLPMRLITLGSVHDYQFSAFGNFEDLERALSFKAQAICRTPPDDDTLPGAFNELGLSLLLRFKLRKDSRDIDYAIMCQEQSLIGSRLLNHYPPWLMNLGVTLLDRFRYLNKKVDIESSIKHLRRATKLIPDNQLTLKARCLDNLASAFATRFKHFGELADLDKSIRSMNEALLRGPSGYPEKARSLNSLGYCLRKRFERLGDVADINLAISSQEESASLSAMHGGSHPEWHINLGNSLTCRFDLLQNLADLNKAIYHLEEVIKITVSSDVLRFRGHNDLGICLHSRFRIERKLQDIHDSIYHLSKAVSCTHDDDAHRAAWLGNLGVSYATRFMHLNRIGDISNAIKYQNQASSLIPEGHVDKCGMLCGLRGSYTRRFARMFRPLELILGIRAFHEASILPSWKPHHRFEAALACARLSTVLDKSFSLIHYELAMKLLPSVVWLGTTVQRRYKDVTSISSAVSEAAAAAIAFREYGQALEWLEQGRSIVWQQTLNPRSPFDNLSRANSTLAARLKEIATQLDYMGAAHPLGLDVPASAPTSEQAAQKHRRLAEDWERLLEEVRRIPGFHNFMRPRAVLELVQSARFGPVVVINVDNSRCDALVVRPNSADITHVPLPHLSLAKVATAHRQLIHSLQRKGVRDRGIRVGKVQQVDMLESILSLWSDVVQPVLESLGYKQTTPVDELPHITWCTTGPLAFLPLHAAGCSSKPRSRVYNYAISSYTPTLSALLFSSQSTHDFRGILAVGQTDTPKFQPLPGTTREPGCIRQQARDVLYTQLDGEKATIAVVLKAIENHSWVHFACHASQDASNPTASAFHLHDGALSLAATMQKSFKNAGLAFLSACQTAKGDADLPDEAVHLAAGMLMAGFPSVIATMWSIQDQDAPVVSEEVYAALLEGGRPDSRRAAKALHMAVRRLREQVGEKEFTSWVPYVHLGI